MKAPKHFSALSLITRIQNQTYNEAIDAVSKQLHAGQPKIIDGLELLGTWFLGDTKIDCYGSVHYSGNRFQELYVEDIAVAGTRISLREAMGAKEWERMEEEVRNQYAKSLDAVVNWRGQVSFVGVH